MSDKPMMNRQMTEAALVQHELHCKRMYEFAQEAGDRDAATIWRVTWMAFADLRRSRCGGRTVRNKGEL